MSRPPASPVILQAGLPTPPAGHLVEHTGIFFLPVIKRMAMIVGKKDGKKERREEKKLRKE